MEEERSYRVCGPLYLVRRCIPVEPLGGLIHCYFPIHPSSPTLVPCLIPSSHVSPPREEVSEVLSVLESECLLLYFTKKQPFIIPPCANMVGPRVPRPVTLFYTFLLGCSSLHPDIVPMSLFYIFVPLSISEVIV